MIILLFILVFAAGWYFGEKSASEAIKALRKEVERLNKILTIRQ